MWILIGKILRKTVKKFCGILEDPSGSLQGPWESYKIVKNTWKVLQDHIINDGAEDAEDSMCKVIRNPSNCYKTIFVHYRVLERPNILTCSLLVKDLEKCLK